MFLILYIHRLKTIPRFWLLIMIRVRFCSAEIKCSEVFKIRENLVDNLLPVLRIPCLLEASSRENPKGFLVTKHFQLSISSLHGINITVE